MSMHLRNSRDMMTNGEESWWNSKTSLEQKLIILASLLFVLSFCLLISVIVISNKKSGASCGAVTVAPNETSSVTEPTTLPTTVAEETTTAETTLAETTTIESTTKPAQAADNAETEPPEELIQDLVANPEEDKDGTIDRDNANSGATQEKKAKQSVDYETNLLRLRLLPDRLPFIRIP